MTYLIKSEWILSLPCCCYLHTHKNYCQEKLQKSKSDLWKERLFNYLIHKENQKAVLCCLDLCALWPRSVQNPQPHTWHHHTQDTGISTGVPGFAEGKGALLVHTSSSSRAELGGILLGTSADESAANHRVCWVKYHLKYSFSEFLDLSLGLLQKLSKNPADNLGLALPKFLAMNADPNTYRHIFSTMKAFSKISVF